jgi:hypothetical protein
MVTNGCLMTAIRRPLGHSATSFDNLRSDACRVDLTHSAGSLKGEPAECVLCLPFGYPTRPSLDLTSHAVTKNRPEYPLQRKRTFVADDPAEIPRRMQFGL